MDDKKSRNDKVFMKLFLTGSFTKVTQEEIDYFRENPELIDEVTAPVNVHKWFLWGGTVLGVILVGLSKILKFNPIIDGLSEGMREFGIDIVFEIGVALIGAAVTAYLLGILLNKQQDNAAAWRAELRRRIDTPD
ncbi:MAG: hypothetical protein ABF326_06095 [Arenicellales bacterium]